MRRFGKIKPDHVSRTKLCPDCEEVKSFDDFPVRKAGTLYTYCNPCNVNRTRRWNNANPEKRSANMAAWGLANRDKLREKAKARYLMSTYGLTEDDLVQKLSDQNSRCAICCTEVTRETLVVDHCHDSDRVRDILCNLCNISLAPIERPGFLDKALAYLERHRSEG